MTSDSRWRLIPPLEASGAEQMAIDRWLWEQHRQGNQPPSLRFYTWSPAAISLGYHQKRWPESWNSLSWNDRPVSLVRRPTGGRAVLHQGDLTYTVVRSPTSSNRVAAYQHICQFLIDGWRSLGFPLHYGSAGRGYAKIANCFATATGAELVLESGYKLIGSAQAWQGSTVLQHGYIRLNPDRQLWSEVFSDTEYFPTTERSPFTHLTHSEIIASLTEAACQTFQMTVAIEPLSEAEWQEIGLLLPKSREDKATYSQFD